jgi:hypothetical protein
MFSKRFLLAVFAFTLMLPLSGCGCRRNCGSDHNYAPPCCDKGAPAGYVPVPGQ